MDTKSGSASPIPPATLRDCDSELEWLLCLCSAYQSKSRRLVGNRISTFRAPGRNRVIAETSLPNLKGRDLPPDVRVPIKSPIHTLRDASRRRLAG